MRDTMFPHLCDKRSSASTAAITATHVHDEHRAVDARHQLRADEDVQAGGPGAPARVQHPHACSRQLEYLVGDTAAANYHQAGLHCTCMQRTVCWPLSGLSAASEMVPDMRGLCKTTPPSPRVRAARSTLGPLPTLCPYRTMSPGDLSNLQHAQSTTNAICSLPGNAPPTARQSPWPAVPGDPPLQEAGICCFQVRNAGCYRWLPCAAAIAAVVIPHDGAPQLL